VINRINLLVRKVKVGSLTFYGVITEIIYLLFFLVEPLKGLLGDNFREVTSDRIFVILFVVFLTLTFIYIKVTRVIDFQKVKFKHIVLFSLLFNLTLLPIRPVMSSDLYTYISRSRVYSEYHANPYTVPYNSFSEDVLYQQLVTRWSTYTAIYGPLFIFFGSLITLIAQNNLFLNIYIFKLFFVIMNIANIFLIKKITNDKKAVLLYSWNPLITLEFALNAHNDVLMISFFLVGVLFLFSKKRNIFTYTSSWLFFFTSVLVKLFTVIFIPFIFIHIIRKLPNKSKFIFLIIAFFGSVVLLIMPFIPFWDGWRIFSRLFEVVQMEGYVTTVGILTLFFFLAMLRVPNPSVLSKVISKSFFYISYTIIVVKSVFDRNIVQENRLLWYLAISASLFYIFFISRFFPWYFTTLITIYVIYVGITKNNSLIALIHGMTLYALSTYIILR